MFDTWLRRENARGHVDIGLVTHRGAVALGDGARGDPGAPTLTPREAMIVSPAIAGAQPGRRRRRMRCGRRCRRRAALAPRCGIFDLPGQICDLPAKPGNRSALVDELGSEAAQREGESLGAKLLCGSRQHRLVRWSHRRRRSRPGLGSRRGSAAHVAGPRSAVPRRGSCLPGPGSVVRGGRGCVLDTSRSEAACQRRETRRAVRRPVRRATLRDPNMSCLLVSWRYGSACGGRAGGLQGVQLLGLLGA